MNIANQYPLVFDGENRIGINIKGVVYLWTENNIPCYVGLTTQYIIQRVRGHLRAKRNLLFHNKLTNNTKAFKCYILYNSSNLQLLENAEKYFIKHYNTFIEKNPSNGYNLTEGGNIFKHTSLTKEKLRKAHIGKKRIITEEHRKNLSNALKGKKKSFEHRQKMIEARNKDSFKKQVIESNKRRKYSIETIEKMSQSGKNRWKKNTILT